MFKLAPILLAEDDPNDVELTLAALAENNLMNNVAVVRDGEEALDYLFCRAKYEKRPKGNPIVVLLDLKMPKLDGVEVLRQIKSDANLKSIPIVVLSSSNLDDDLTECYKLGANAYVVKPVDFTNFVDAVKKLGMFWAIINEPPPGSVKKPKITNV